MHAHVARYIQLYVLCNNYVCTYVQSQNALFYTVCQGQNCDPLTDWFRPGDQEDSF